MLCELLVLSPEDSEKIASTTLKYYTYSFNDKQECFVLGLGALFNHSDTPNVSYHLIQEDGRYMMIYHAIRPIEANEELFIDYNADGQVNVMDYIAFKPLMSQ